MADPFSIATGAVGILGLAASMTKSIHEFSTSVKTSSETLLQIRVNTDILSHMLSDLSPVLSDESVEPHEKEVIQKCVNSCTDNFKRIETIVRPFMDESAGNAPETTIVGIGPGENEILDRSLNNQIRDRSIVETKGKFRMKLRRLGWPFREKETKELLDIIDRTIQHIGLALDMVHSKTSLKVLSLAEYQKNSLDTTYRLVDTIESRTIEIETVVRTNSDTLREIKLHSQKASDSIEVRLQQLEDAQKVREDETQKLLLQLLNKFESSGASNRIETAEVTHAVDPLARKIMETTLKQDFAMKSANSRRALHIREEPPPAYSLKDTAKHGLVESYTTTAKDWAWDTPFGRIAIFTTHHQRDENNSGVTLKKDRSASRYKMMFTPAPWLYNKTAAFAFIKKVDGFGLQFTTPATFKTNEPALRYLRRGEFEKMRNAIAENGFLLNAVHEHSGRTLLAEAVRCRRLGACKYLLELGADPETEDNRGSTVFNLLFNLNIKPYQVTACLKIFSLLLSTRADLFRGKATVMHSAVTTQYVNLDPKLTLEILNTVYTSVSNLTSIDEPDVTGNSPLVSACTYGHDNPVVIDFLLQNGAARRSALIPEKFLPKSQVLGIYNSPTYASPALYATARAGYIASMRRIFESGTRGDPNIRSDYGRTILHNNIRRSVKYNTPRKSANTKVSQFTQKHELWKDNFQYLIDQGADINAVDPNGWTVLHCATLGPFCDPELLEVLIDCGVDVNVRDNDGNTAWELALKYGRVKLKAWKWFGVQMFERGWLREADLKGHIARGIYMKNRSRRDSKGENEDDGDVEEVTQNFSLEKVPDDDEWMFMSSMHPYESEQVFGEDVRLDPEGTNKDFLFPIEEFWYRDDVERINGRSGTRQAKARVIKKEVKNQSQAGEEGNRTWFDTVGIVLGAFAG